MNFARLALHFRKLESTSGRLKMTAILAELFKEAKAQEIDKICFLSLGRLAPLYAGVEFNLADKMMIRILARAYRVGEGKVRVKYRKVGDLGAVAEELATRKHRTSRQTRGAETRGKKKLSVDGVYNQLYRVATASGLGSQEKKITLLSQLLRDLDGLSARYVVRIPLGKMRLGFSDVTILEALSWMVGGDKSLRPQIEHAYNIRTNIGEIAQVFRKKGVKGVQKMRAEVGIPIRTAQAERLPTAAQIVEKLGQFAVEPKMDGFRTQIHLDKRRRFGDRGTKEQGSFEGFGGLNAGPFVRIYSRNMENTTAMFPDIVAAAQKLPVKRAIIDGEAIAYNPETGEFLPFQETVQRKRKYGILKKVKEVPLKVFAFDLLYLDGKDLLSEPFLKRRKLLEKVVPKKNTIMLTRQKVVSSKKGLKDLFDFYISEGLEGVMCKKLDSSYQAGARNFNWVKYKRATEGELADTIDAVVLGYYRGKGKRVSFGIGAFLVGIYSPEQDRYFTIAKIGTGLTDRQWGEMKKQADEVKTSIQPQQYEVPKELKADVWCNPKIVVEIKADEITRSPIHTAAPGSDVMTDSKTGLALRFPRLVRFRDKKPTDITTIEEVLRLYGFQKKQG